VNIDNADLLETVDLRIAYDTTLLDVTSAGVRKGSLASASTVTVNVDDASGMIYVSMLMRTPLSGGAGSLLEIDFHVVSNAAPSVTRIDLQSLSLNEGQLVLTIVPVNGADSTDGILTIQPIVTSKVRVAEVVAAHDPVRSAETPSLPRGKVPASPGGVDLSYLGRAMDQPEGHDEDSSSSDWFRKLSRGRKPLRSGSLVR
jgi:hypothetical protein